MTEQPLDIKIESRNVGMTPRWKDEIERRVHALESGIIRPTHARVTLTKNAHHKKGADNAEALVVITLPPKRTVTARKESKTFEEAIRAAFHAVDHELDKIEEKRIARAAKAAGKKAEKAEALSVA
jgi:ribosome-associated translation inhibitor RaiA